MLISRLDHLVLTVSDIDATCDFYHTILGMEIVTFNHDRKALRFGNQKINLHLEGREFEPKASRPTTGSADLCFVTELTIKQVVENLHKSSVSIELGPLERTGACGAITSVYIRDPDLNLIEIATYSK